MGWSILEGIFSLRHIWLLISFVSTSSGLTLEKEPECCHHWELLMLFGLANHSGESLENKSAAIYFAQLPQIDTPGWLGEANINKYSMYFAQYVLQYILQYILHNIFCKIYFAIWIFSLILHNFPKLTPWAGWVKLTSIYFEIYLTQYIFQYVSCKIYFAMYILQYMFCTTSPNWHPGLVWWS